MKIGSYGYCLGNEGGETFSMHKVASTVDEGSYRKRAAPDHWMHSYRQLPVHIWRSLIKLGLTGLTATPNVLRLLVTDQADRGSGPVIPVGQSARPAGLEPATCPPTIGSRWCSPISRTVYDPGDEAPGWNAVRDRPTHQRRDC
jgi:hypothetical protein